MIYTLAEARQHVKAFVDNGSCNTSVIDERINEALLRLTDHADFSCMQAIVRIAACDLSFTLPYNVEKIIWADVNGVPAKMFNTAHQFLSSGPSDMDLNKDPRCGFNDIMDQGEFPTQFDLPMCYNIREVMIDLHDKGIQLAAFSTHKEDAGKMLQIRGFGNGRSGDMVNAGIGPGGIELPIQQWHGGVEGQLQGFWGRDIEKSPERFVEVTEVLKPETKGYVTLFAVDASNDPSGMHNFFSFLAKYHPRETRPAFRRYAITNRKTEDCPAAILALVRMRVVPLVDPDDILPIDSLSALRLMVTSLREERAGNLQQAEMYEGKALAVLLNRERAREMASGMGFTLDVDYRGSLGETCAKYNGFVL